MISARGSSPWPRAWQALKSDFAKSRGTSRASSESRLRLARNVGIYPRMETTCYCAAVRTAARKTTALYDALLEPAGVTLAQFSLLRKIKRAGTVSLTGLGRLAELDRSTIGRNVRALEKLRLVSMASAEDHREAAVRLTPEGERALRVGGPLVGRSPAAGRSGAWRDRRGAAAGARAPSLIFLASLRVATRHGA